MTQSGVVLPLALLAFATFFGAPVITALVAGDIVSSEDANNTLKMILTRSTGRGTIYAAKALAAATYGIALRGRPLRDAIVGSLIAWGLHGATLLDGTHIGGGHALGLDALAYATYLMPLAVLVGVAVLPVYRDPEQRRRDRRHRHLRARIPGHRRAARDRAGAKPYCSRSSSTHGKPSSARPASRSRAPPGPAPSTPSYHCCRLGGLRTPRRRRRLNDRGRCDHFEAI